MNPFDYTGRRVLITGASRGLGRAMAEGYAKAGADLVISARKKSALSDLERPLLDLGAGSVLSVAADLGERDGADTLAAAALEGGHVDVLVNNAGISAPVKFEESTDEDWDHVFAVNFMGVVRLTRAIGRAMLERGDGSVIMVGSVLGRTAISQTSPYIASKGAIEQLTRALAVEWARRGVRVNTLAPGFMDTEMVEESDGGSLHNYVMRRTPMRRLGRPDELVSAALYLGSAASSYVTGSFIHVDGGWTAS